MTVRSSLCLVEPAFLAAAWSIVCASTAFFVRIASRHANRSRDLFGPDGPQLQSVEADIEDSHSVADALAGAYGAVNAVSLYVERRGKTFHAVHVEAARRLAARAQQNGLERFVQVSGIGADLVVAASIMRWNSGRRSSVADTRGST
jgi:hypothetical protein